MVKNVQMFNKEMRKYLDMRTGKTVMPKRSIKMKRSDTESDAILRSISGPDSHTRIHIIESASGIEKFTDKLKKIVEILKR